MNSYVEGMAQGVAMTDEECVRFYNGMLAAVSNDRFTLIFSPDACRRAIPLMMGMLHGEGMVATVGYRGTPIIQPAQR